MVKSLDWVQVYQKKRLIGAVDWVAILQVLTGQFVAQLLIPGAFAQPTLAQQSVLSVQESAVLQETPLDSESAPTQILPYPVQLLPGQEDCLILPIRDGQSPSFFETPQERYAYAVWTAQEKWVWQQLCRGEVANLKTYLVYLFPQIQTELNDLASDGVNLAEPVDQIDQPAQLVALLKALQIDITRPINKIEQTDVLIALIQSAGIGINEPIQELDQADALIDIAKVNGIDLRQSINEIKQPNQLKALLQSTKLDLRQSISAIQQPDTLKAFLKAIDVDIQLSIYELT